MPADSTAPSQSASAVLMVRPCHFASNPQTAASNTYQQFATAPTPAVAQAAAAAEFDGVVEALERADVDVIVVDDTERPVTPDAIFPNNWFSTHCDGRVVLYPMLAENRRDERRPDLFDDVLAARGYTVGGVLNLSDFERQGAYLEGTGSVVLDRVTGTAYAARSPRTHPAVAEALALALGYQLVLFDAVDEAGQAVYHTNVVMAVGTGFAVVCLAALNADARDDVAARLRASGRELIEISPAQMASFAGNVLEVRSRAGELRVAMSASAHDAFTSAQRERLARHATPVVAPVPTIEHCSGGSVRCMLAEIFLPRPSHPSDD